MPQPPRNQSFPLLTIDDFSPGIIQRTNVVGQSQNSPARMGGASITNTYRCIALPGGGLGPLPKLKTSRLVSDLSTAAIPTTAAIQAIKIVGPLLKTTNSPVFPPLPAIPYELHVMYEYAFGGTQHQVWRKYPYYSGDASVAIVDRTQTTTNRIGPAWLNLMRINHAAPSAVGFPTIVGSWSSPNDPAVATTDYCFAYPDPTDITTAATDATHDLGVGFIGPGMVHQNRYLSFRRGLDVHGANSGKMATNERLVFTLPNDYTEDSPSSATVFGQEIPVGYGAWCSITDSGLLLIKHQSGAYLVQGDMLNPIIRKMPGVISTGGLEQIACMTSIGVVYGSRDDGVFVWGGGDGSTEISDQLEDGFWQTTTPIVNFGGGFAAWGDLIVTPNNFLYDSMSKSWWRMEDPAVAVYLMYDRDPINNLLFAAPATVLPGGQIANVYDQNTPASNFSWQSQPISLADRRTIQLREVLLVAQGTGTVTVTIATDGSVASQPVAFNISSSTPKLSRVNMSAKGTEFTVRIVSDGGSGPAPIVYKIEIPHQEDVNVVTN